MCGDEITFRATCSNVPNARIRDVVKRGIHSARSLTTERSCGINSAPPLDYLGFLPSTIRSLNPVRSRMDSIFGEGRVTSSDFLLFFICRKYWSKTRIPEEQM